MSHGRRGHLLASAAGAVVATLLSSQTAAAEPTLETATLSYVVTASSSRCPDEESFRHQVAARLGYQPFASAGTHRVVVRFSERSGRLHGHAEVERGGRGAGIRDLESGLNECGPLAAALAVAIAIAIDPVHAQTLKPSPPVDPPPEASAEVLVPPPPVAPPDASEQPPSNEQVPRRADPDVAPARVFAFAGALATGGLMPAPSLGGSVAFGLRWRGTSLELSGRAESMLGAARVSSDDRVEGTAFSGMLAACGHLDRVSACGLGRAGALQGRAPDVVSPSLGTTIFGTVGARVGYTQPLSRSLALRGAASAEVMLVRTSFIIDGTSVWTAPLVLGALEIGAQFTFP